MSWLWSTVPKMIVECLGCTWKTFLLWDFIPAHPKHHPIQEISISSQNISGSKTHPQPNSVSDRILRPLCIIGWWFVWEVVIVRQCKHPNRSKTIIQFSHRFESVRRKVRQTSAFAESLLRFVGRLGKLPLIETSWKRRIAQRKHSVITSMHTFLINFLVVE